MSAERAVVNLPSLFAAFFSTCLLFAPLVILILIGLSGGA